jgi:DNA-binding CsgD family transcriptional regulator
MPRRPDRITPGQLAALRLAANGMTSRQIAVRLGTTEQGIHIRLTAVAHTLGARSRTHAVALALRMGLLRLDEVEMGHEQPQAPASRPETPSGSAACSDPLPGRQTAAQPRRNERNVA